MNLLRHQRICLDALKYIFGVGLLAGIVLLVLNGCGKKVATFTPSTTAPTGIVTEVEAIGDAATWASAKPGRYWTTVADTGSMEPFFSAKSLPLLVRYTGQTVPNGTVAVFNRGDVPRVMHVISDQTATHVYMSGVSNRRSDGWFPKTSIEGIVVGQIFRP